MKQPDDTIGNVAPNAARLMRSLAAAGGIDRDHKAELSRRTGIDPTMIGRYWRGMKLIGRDKTMDRLIEAFPGRAAEIEAAVAADEKHAKAQRKVTEQARRQKPPASTPTSAGPEADALYHLLAPHSEIQAAFLNMLADLRHIVERDGPALIDHLAAQVQVAWQRRMATKSARPSSTAGDNNSARSA